MGTTMTGAPEAGVEGTPPPAFFDDAPSGPNAVVVAFLACCSLSRLLRALFSSALLRLAFPVSSSENIVLFKGRIGANCSAKLSNQVIVHSPWCDR